MSAVAGREQTQAGRGRGWNRQRACWRDRVRWSNRLLLSRLWQPSGQAYQVHGGLPEPGLEGGQEEHGERRARRCRGKVQRRYVRCESAGEQGRGEERGGNEIDAAKLTVSYVVFSKMIRGE